ncbi:MAG: MAPEG family protein [Legionellaceae bacterium]|nr:MAPEG family protein [Legionellaceae bacterium]
MDNRYLIFAVCVSLLCFLYLYLSCLVILQRRKHRLAYLTNQDKAFIVRFRAHANFTENVPFALILLAIAMVLGMSEWLFLMLAILLVFGRGVHAFGLIWREQHQKFFCRILGMGLTFLVMATLAIFNLGKALLLFRVLNG